MEIELVLLVTSHEVESGLAEACLRGYIDKCTEPINITISSNRVIVNESLRELTSDPMVNRCIMHSCDIAEQEDVYSMKDEPVESPHELGESNGPNLLFYRTFDFLKQLDAEYFMVIECDTEAVVGDWLLKLVGYCEMRRSQFLIGGSRYKGDVKLPPSDWREHLNGVALYKNHSDTYELIDASRELLKHYIHKKNYVRLNYDVALWYYVNSPAGDKYLSQVIDTNIIANYSLPADREIKAQTILDKHPFTVILHQKQ